MMFDNASSMNEGAQVAQDIRSPDDLLTYIAAHPKQASLVAYDVNAPTEGVFYQADAVRTATRIPVLQLMAGYAERVAQGGIRPERRVSLDSLAVFSLPGVTQSNHEQMEDALRKAERVDAERTVTLNDAMTRIAQTGGRTASDWWMAQQGRPAVEALPQQLQLSNSTPPRPLTGLALLGRGASAETLSDVSSRTITQRTFALAQRLRRDTTFRKAQYRDLDRDGSSLTLEEQRTLALRTYPHGTARDYATLVEGIATGRTPSPNAASLLHDLLERPVTVPDSVAVPFTHVATYGGATPGVMSFVGYARYPDRPPRVVAMLLDDLPLAVMYHLLQTGIDKGLQLQLLGDRGALSRVHNVLASSAPTTASPGVAE